MGRRAFTLVELIITIAVIAVLAVTAFLVITKWISKSRDSSRLQDIAVIQQGLETEIVNTKSYPMPDNYTGVYDTGNALAWYQGEFTDNVRSQIVSLSKLPKDPQGRSYGYSLSNDKKQYQLRAFLENTSYNDNYIDTASAATQVSKINGNYNGFLVTRQSYSTGNVYSLWNIPTMFLWSGTVFSSGINYVNENNKPVDNTTNIRFADVSGLYDADSANNASILDGIVTTFSGSNGVSSQSLASLTMKTAAGGVSVGVSNCPVASAPDSYTKLLLHFDNNFTDIATSKTVTNNGVTFNTINKIGGYSANFNGNSSYLYLSNSVDWDFGSSPYTIEGWFYLIDRSQERTFFARYSGEDKNSFIVDTYPGTNKIRLYAFNSAGTRADSIYSWFSTNDFTLNTWHHIALVQNGSSLKLYMDGNLEINFPVFSQNIINTIPFYIGIRDTSLSYSWLGYIDEFRISKGIARRTSNFTPSSCPY